MTRSRFTAVAVAALALLLGGCGEEPSAPAPPADPIPLGERPEKACVLVLNTLSETISRLDPATGAMEVQAALAGTWTNRITASPDLRLLLVAESGGNEVAVLRASDLAHLARIDLGAGRNPWVARVLEGDRALVSNWLHADVVQVDLRSGKAGAAATTTPGPEGFAIQDGEAFVACTNYQGAEGSYGEGRVDVVDLTTMTVEASIPVGRNPQDVLVAPDGTLHVLCTGDYSSGGVEAGRVDVIDPLARVTLATLPLGGSPTRLALGPDGAVWVARAGGGLRRYDPSTRAVLEDAIDPQLADAPLSAIAGDAHDRLIYVTSFELDLLAAIDADTRTVTGTWLVGDGPIDVLAIRPESR